VQSWRSAVPLLSVELHGGRLRATANSGRGATFYFALPTATEVLQAPATGM